MKSLIFKNWESLWHVGVCAVLAYFILFLIIRISGKRTLAKLTAFDFVVTITLGSTLSSMILGKVTLAEGAVALAIIICLQYLLAWTARESKPNGELTVIKKSQGANHTSLKDLENV